jgi:hypothetical protein
MNHRFHTMKPSIAALSLLVTLVSCEKDAPSKASEPKQPVQPAPAADSAKDKETPTAVDTPDDLKKLQGKLPRIDPEKAKFIAVPSTPPDPKPTGKPEAAETIVKAVPAAPQEQPEPSQAK